MKRLTWLAATVAVLLLGVGCDTVSQLDTPVVTAAAIDNGAKLRLTWTAVTDADEYEIDVDGTVYTTAQLSYDVAGPAKMVKVYAKAGDTRSDAAEVDCAVEETSTLEVYGISDPSVDHPSGFGVNSDWTVVPYSITQANYAAMDFYMEDVALPMSIVNTGDKGWNAKGNAGKDAASTNYDDVRIADAPGAYSTQTAIAQGGVYFLWLDRTNDNWSTDDHFAKAKVVSISGAKVTMKIGVQPVGGLRWVMN